MICYNNDKGENSDNLKKVNYDYAFPEPYQINDKNIPASVENKQNVKNTTDHTDDYFVLEKQCQYELAQPMENTDNTYTITDTEYAVSGQNYHKNKDANVYSRSGDTLYDSTIHTKKSK